MPAVGYNRKQLKDLEETISRIECDAIVLGTPASIDNIITINRPVVRIRFFAKEVDGEPLKNRIVDFITKMGSKQ